jgi:CBS domain-containing protein
MQVRDVMQEKVITIDKDKTTAMAASIMKADNVGSLIVTSGDTVLGIVTDRDIAIRCTAQHHAPDECSIGSHTSQPLTSVTPEADALETLHIMAQREIKRIPVFEGSHVVGVISHSDLAAALIAPVYELLIGTGRVYKR